MFTLNKFSLIITTRCNLRCKLCCEYVPQSVPFPDMTVSEAEGILAHTFEVCDYIGTLHLTGGGEPFLHQQLPELIEVAMIYTDKFNKLMLFTNSLPPISSALLNSIIRHRDKIVVQLSQYGIAPEHEQVAAKILQENDINCKIEKYYGDNQSFGGWVDFGTWESRNQSEDKLASVFQNCAVTRDMHGNWRTRDGKVHWCTRSQRGTELGTIPNFIGDYVDLFDGASIDEKRAKFKRIASAKYIAACDHCSGDQGTSDEAKRHRAAEQMGR